MSIPRIALVTGANKGIGLEVVRELAAKGLHVYLGSRDVTAGEAAVAEVKGSVCTVQLDVLDPESIASAVAAISEGRLDVLINNAGAIESGDDSILTLASETARRSFEINTLGALRVTQAFLPLLRKSDAPRVINVASAAGQLSGELQAWSPAYSISKTALNAVTLQLAAELPGFAINSVCPGWVRTSMGGKDAPRSVEQGADTIVWLAHEAPHGLRAKFLKDRMPIEW